MAAAAGCLVALAAAPLGCGSDAERAERHVERARELLAEQNQDAATIELRIAAQTDPANREASWLLAKIAIRRPSHGAKEGGGKELTTAATAVEVNVKQIVSIELSLEP